MLTRSAGVLTLAGALLFSAGCSGNGDDKASKSVPPSVGSSPGAPSSPGPAASPVTGDQLKPAADAQQKLEACLRKEGIKKVPTSQEKLSPEQQAVIQQCGLQAISGLNPGMQSKIDAVRACMRGKPVTAAALKACQDQVPAG